MDKKMIPKSINAVFTVALSEKANIVIDKMNIKYPIDSNISVFLETIFFLSNSKCFF